MSLARPWIDPANPPLPTPMNLPFHLSTGGSHISILISESDEGLRSSCTRQCAGMMAGAGGGPPARAACGALPRAAALRTRGCAASLATAAGLCGALGDHFCTRDHRFVELDRCEAFAGHRGR